VRTETSSAGTTTSVEDHETNCNCVGKQLTAANSNIGAGWDPAGNIVHTDGAKGTLVGSTWKLFDL